MISHVSDSDPEPNLFQQGTLFEHELILTVLVYVEENNTSTVGPDLLQTFRTWSTPIAKEPEDSRTMNDWSSWTYRFFYDLNSGGSAHIGEGFCSPLQHVSFQPFMRLGFAWVTDRMNGYGLLYGEPYLANYHGYLHA